MEMRTQDALAYFVRLCEGFETLPKLKSRIP